MHLAIGPAEYDDAPLGIVPDVSDDLRFVDGLKPFTLKVQGQPDVEIPEALDEPVTWAEMEASKGQVQKGDHLIIWSTQYSDRPPLGAVLVDENDVYWTVLSVEYKDQVETWEAQCRNLSIRTALDNTATVLRATYTKAAGNDIAPHWRGAFSNRMPPVPEDTVRAHFQPSAEDALVFLGAEWTKRTYRVVFEKHVPVELAGGEYRLVDSQGKRYRIMHYLDRERIDTLPVAIAVQIVEGAENAQGPDGMPHNLPPQLPRNVRGRGRGRTFDGPAGMQAR